MGRRCRTETTAFRLGDAGTTKRKGTGAVKNRSGRYLIAMVALLVAGRWPDSVLAGVVRYAAPGYILIDMLFMARAGYLRRLPHWSPQSWRRYFTACAIPVGALLIFVCMETAAESGLLQVGAARSTMRSIWAGGMLVLMAVGAVGIAIAISWLTEGEPSLQFTRFQRRHRSPQTPGSAT